MNQYEIPGFLEDAIPEIKQSLRALSILPPYNAYQAIQCLSEFTLRKFGENDLRAVKKSFYVAEQLYLKGDNTVKNAIDNVYVHSFSLLFSSCETRKEKFILQALMPLYLYASYVRQIVKSNI